MFSVKNIAVILTVLVSSQITNATDCLRNICVGMNALTTNNEVVAVTAIKGDKVVYQSGYYSQEIAPENLSKQVPKYQDLEIGKTVLNSSNEIGVIQMVFENGKAQYQVGYYSFVASGLSPEVEKVGALKVGTVVVNPSNELGKVLKVFKNNQVQYSVGYYNYVVASNTLSEEVTQFGDFKMGVTLMTPSETIGTVQNTFADGRVRYCVGYYTYTNKADELSAELKVIGPLSKNTVVMNSGNEIGTVLLLFKNEKVQYQSGYYTYVAKANSLSPQVSTVGGLREGQTVIDSGNKIGTTKYLFADGRIQYVSGYYTFVEKNLIPEVEQLTNWRTGALAINKANQVGNVKRMFKDGRIEFIAGYYSMIERDQDLSPEVDSHPTYEKNKWYGTDSYRAGQIKHAFQNGKVQVQTTEDQLFVYAQLYPEISNLLDTKAGSEVAEVQFKKAKVVAVFENGTVLYEYTIRVKTDNPEEFKEKIVKASAKLFGAKGNMLSEEQAQLDTEGWLQNLAYFAAISGDSFRTVLAIAATPTVVNFDKLAETKELLIKYLEKNPKLISDPDIRKKVFKFLGEDAPIDNGTTEPTPIDNGEGYVVKLNDPNYLPEVDKWLKGKKISYNLVDVISRTPSLEIVIQQRVGLLSTACAINTKLSQANYVMTASKTKKVFSLFKKKNPCRNAVKKILNSLLLGM